MKVSEAFITLIKVRSRWVSGQMRQYNVQYVMRLQIMLQLRAVIIITTVGVSIGGFNVAKLIIAPTAAGYL